MSTQLTDNPGLDFHFDCKPDFSYLTVQIPEGETLKVEASAMATMDTNIKMKTKMKGGFGRLLTGENIFMNDFTAENGPGEIGIAPGSPGDMGHVHLDGNTTLFLQNSAFVCSTTGVVVETKWQGFMKGFFSGEGLFLIKCSGHGDLWFSTYGAMIPIDVDGEYTVDNNYIVAFEETLDYDVGTVGVSNPCSSQKDWSVNSAAKVVSGFKPAKPRPSRSGLIRFGHSLSRCNPK